MKNQFNLGINKPCNENFDNFSPTSNGGFCGSCEKEVIDFTAMNQEEIINYFKNRSTQDTCGRFNNVQLKAYTPKRKRLSFLSGIGLACLSIFSLTTVQAQDVNKQSIPSDKNNSETKASKFEKSITVKGKVKDDSGPLPGVNVILEGTTTGTQTNFDGDFEFPVKLKKGDVLVFSFLGLKTQKLVVDTKNSESKIELNVNMEMDACIIMGKVAVKEVYKSKRD